MRKLFMYSHRQWETPCSLKTEWTQGLSPYFRQNEPLSPGKLSSRNTHPRSQLGSQQTQVSIYCHLLVEKKNHLHFGNSSLSLEDLGRLEKIRFSTQRIAGCLSICVLGFGPKWLGLRDTKQVWKNLQWTLGLALPRSQVLTVSSDVLTLETHYVETAFGWVTTYTSFSLFW